MGNNCIYLTDVEQKIADSILKAYPEACHREGFDAKMCCDLIGAYITDNNKSLNFRPDAKTLVNWVEKKRNMSGSSFLYVPESITYNLPGQAKQTYTIIGNKIFNKNGEEVFPSAGVHRNRIFANLAVQQGRAVVVTHNKKRYVVNNRNQIISVTSGKIMKWGEENGDRREILRLAQNAFREKEKEKAATTASNAASEENENKGVSAINPEESRLSDKEAQEIEQIITVAPYFRNRLTSNNKKELEKATKKVLEKAQKLAATMGLQIEAVEVVGGTYLGDSEITYQYRIKSSDQELVDLFAALMADLSFEYQDAVIAANYTKDKSQITAYELTWKAPEDTTIEKIESLLKSLGIDGSTYHFSNGELDITAFSEEETQEIINKLKDTDYEFKEFNGQNSRYLDNKYRRNAYQSWLNSERGEQNRQLSNACQKALAICEAAAQYPDIEDAESHPEEQKKQEQLRLATAQEAARNWKPNTVSPPSQAAQTGTQAAQEANENTQSRPQRPKSSAYESALKPNTSRMADFKRTFTPQQIKDRGDMISDIFSDILDTIVQDEIEELEEVLRDDSASEEQKTEARLRIRELKDPVNGRQKKAAGYGIINIINRIIRRLRTAQKHASQEDKIKYQNTIDYFTELFNIQASIDIEEREGIRIVNLELAEKSTEEEEVEATDMGDDETGHIVSGSDGWNFQVRYENPFNTLSKKVRGMLYEIMRPESDKDDLGIIRKYPMGQIYASLLSSLSKNMTSPDQFLQIYKNFEDIPENISSTIYATSDNFNVVYPHGFPVFPALEKMMGAYPWVQQVIQRLTDDYTTPEVNTDLRYPSTGGAMASQFYTTFRLAYIPYGKVELGGNHFGVTPLNYEMAERVQYDKLLANYNNRMVFTSHSIYDASGKINKNNANWLRLKIKENITYIDQHKDLFENLGADYVTQEMRKEYDGFIDSVRNVFQSFGISATQDSVVSYLMMEEQGLALRDMLSNLDEIAYNVSKVDDKNIDSFNYILDTANNSKKKLWAHFFEGKGLITDTSYMQSFYDSASHKTKYSYSADNYLMRTFRGVAMGTKGERQRFINEHFGKFEWFRNQKMREGTGWRNKWLEFWYNYEGDVSELPYRNIDNITEYTEDGTVIRPYIKWTPDDIWNVQDRSYDMENYKKNTSFYLSPIFSDSPMSMTVKGPRMTMEELLYGYTENRQHQRGAMIELVNQELWRIGYAQRREQAIKEGTVKPIANFDNYGDAGGYGKKFCFLPELNSYVFEATEDYPEQSFLDRMLSLKKDKSGKVTMAVIESYQIKAVRDIMTAKMNAYAAENSDHYKDSGIDEAQYYNMAYANAAIIQLTAIDLAFYDGYDDFQKRFKQVYAGGIQLNTNSKYGKKTENVLLVSDLIITSPSYDKVAAVIDGSSNLTDKDKDRIKETFMDINVADGQAIRSIASFRAILDMMGKWDDTMEEALNNFRNGNWHMEDFEVIYQTIKPFVYAVIERNDGFGNTFLVPQQHKNSEICALMMYDLITNGLNNSPYYKAFSRFMQDAVDSEGNPLIDMIQFESAGKVGNQGVINVSFNPEKVMAIIEKGIVIDGEEFEFSTAYKDGKYLDNTLENAKENYEAIKEDLDKELASGKTTQKEYNKIMSYIQPTEEEIISMLEKAALITNGDGTKSINTEVVHTIPFENYCQQQPTPEHHIDAEAVYGSQARNLAVADLPDDFEVTLTGRGKNKKTFKGKDAVIDFYYELLNENLIDDFFGRGSKKGLKGIFESKESLRDAVTEIVRGNPKYGQDFIEALQLDDNNNFVLSPNSPTMFNLMQELVTSFFKNRITKQTINGAALIQAAGIGLDKNLRLLFENNKLVGAECYMPLTSKRFFEPLLKKKIINGEEVMYLDPEVLKKAGLDKAVGYRIPTENKSSMLPLIIKGFTPLQNGSVIVLPAEITDIAGSDFDVDKMFVMLLSFNYYEYDIARAKKDFARTDSLFMDILNGLAKARNTSLDALSVEEFDEIQTEAFNEWWEENKENYRLEKPYIKKIEYDFSKSPRENSRKARNNMLIQLTYNILTSKEGSESVLNPQGFPDVEYAAKVIRILTDPVLKEQLIKNTSGEAAPGMLPSADVIVSEFLNILQQRYPDRYEEYKKKVMKMSSEEVISAYLQAVSAGNKGNAVKLLLNSSVRDLNKFIKLYSTPESPVYPQVFMHSHARNMAGVIQIGIYAIQASMAAKYQRANVILREDHRFKINGRTISRVDVSDGGKRVKNEGQMVGASADNGKKPNLTDMGSTSKTAPIIGYMLRAGLTHFEAALIINQDYMHLNPNSKYFKEILGPAPWKVPAEVTSDMLIRSLISPFELTTEEERAIAALCWRILKQNEAQEYITKVSRADSPNGSIGHTYAKARIQQYNVDLMQAKMGQDEFPFIRINEALSNSAVDTAASADVIREQLRKQPMGLLHGMYALGINSFNNLVAPYFFGAQKWFDDSIVKPILYNLNEHLSNERKEAIVNNIYTSYITYMLSGSPLFGNEEGYTMKSKRDYYLYAFPDDFQKTLQENPDISDLLGSVLQVDSLGSRKRVVLRDAGSLDKKQKQDIQFRFESLCTSDNPVAGDLAKKLLLFSYYDSGLQFTHDSFSHLFTPGFLANFPVYNEALLKLDQEISKEEQDNFISQFLLTYPTTAISVDGIVMSDEVVNDTITIDLNNSKMRKFMINELMSPNPHYEGINVYPYISLNGDVFILSQEDFEADASKAVYHKVNRYATFPKMPLFSYQMSVNQMAQEFPVTEQAVRTAQEAPEYEEDPILQGEMPSIDDDDFSMADNSVPHTGTYTDTVTEDYSSEGRAVMNEDFCSGAVPA